VLTVAPPDARGHQDTVRDSGCSATVRSREQDRLPSAFTEYRSANPLLQRTLPLAGAARQSARSKRDATAPGSKWGNPFKPAMQGHAVVVALYRRWLGVSQSCWPRCPISAAATWSAGARRSPATAMCCCNAVTRQRTIAPQRCPDYRPALQGDGEAADLVPRPSRIPINGFLGAESFRAPGSVNPETCEPPSAQRCRRHQPPSPRRPRSRTSIPAA
jgi:hypothetical protein